MIQKVKELAVKYGTAFVVVNQTLGWITFFIIYFYLLYADFDIAAYLQEKKFSAQIVQVAQTGGLFALSFALNRVLMPLRLGLTMLILPLTADKINSVVDPWLAYFSNKDKKNE